MRQFTDLTEAASEILRDLSRAIPSLQLGVQQHRGLSVVVREALNYQYSLPLTTLLAVDFARFSEVHFFLNPTASPASAVQWWRWMEMETEAREAGEELGAFNLHPLREQFLENGRPSYLYPLILGRAYHSAAQLLKDAPDSRRCWIPIFERSDFNLARESTRVPCSLGYHFLVREVGPVPYFHMTYVMRACDLRVFWLTDLLLAARAADYVMGQGLDSWKPGHLVHNIFSFHLIEAVGGTEEIY